MATKLEIQEQNDKLRKDVNLLRAEIGRMRDETHKSIKGGSTWNNSYLIQHFTELLERTKP